jgi:hypothetical protein
MVQLQAKIMSEQKQIESTFEDQDQAKIHQNLLEKLYKMAEQLTDFKMVN